MIQTLALDEVRFAELRHKLFLVEILGSIVLVSLSQNIGSMQISTDFRQLFKEHLSVVLGHPKSVEATAKMMPSIATQVIQDIDNELEKQKLSPLGTDAKNLIIGQISVLSEPDNKVRTIIRKHRLVVTWGASSPTEKLSLLS